MSDSSSIYLPDHMFFLNRTAVTSSTHIFFTNTTTIYQIHIGRQTYMKYHIIGTYSTYYIIQDIMMVVFIRDLIVKRISIRLGK